ncbi:hypothetical protein BT69DRAFT_1345134 [Atractiella rhizophila]|nr:hypothetical protein BT69DRAFT_1345134 [Atractiella rhizophila]
MTVHRWRLHTSQTQMVTMLKKCTMEERLTERVNFSGLGKLLSTPIVQIFSHLFSKLAPDNTSIIPSFDGVIMVAVQTAPLNAIFAETSWFNFSSVPQFSIPPSWRTYQEEWLLMGNGPIAKETSILLCLPQFSVQSYSVAVDSAQVGGQLENPLPYRVGNIDETQLKIALSDSLHELARTAPSIFTTEFVDQERKATNLSNSTLVDTPVDANALSESITDMVRGALSAYLTGGPFGTTVIQSHGYRMGLVLRAQNEFLWIVAASFFCLAVAGGLVLVLQHREKRLERQLSIAGVLRLVRWDKETSLVGEKWLNGRGLMEFATDLTTGCGMTDEEEEKVHFAFRNSMVRIADFPAASGTVPTVRLQMTPAPMRKFKIEGRSLRKLLGFITPVVGGAFIAFGAYAYTHDVIIPEDIGDVRPVLLGTTFTVVIGSWRTLALGGTRSSIREVRSEEWTRLSSRATTQGIMAQENVRTAIGDVSTNTTSTVDQLRRSVLFKPHSLISKYYRLAVLSFLIMSVCSITSQGAIQLRRRVVSIGSSEPVAINAYSTNVSSLYTILSASREPWSTSQGIGNSDLDFAVNGWRQEFLISSGVGYIEEELDIAVAVQMPPSNAEGYFLLQPAGTEDLKGISIRFLTDLGVWKMSCEWAAPRLQPWSADINSSSFVSIQLMEHNLQGLVAVPSPFSWFTPLQMPQRMDNEEFISSGLFAWTLFAGSRINVDNAPFSDLSAEWRDWLTSEISQYNPDYGSFYEIPTRLTTLVCGPNIKIFYNSEVTIYNNTASIRKRNRESEEVGNLEFGQLAFQVYAMGSMLGESELGRFSDNLLIGSRAGHVALSNSSDANSIVLRTGAEAARSLNSILTSELKLVATVNIHNVTTLSAPVGERYVVDVSLPQLVASGVMFAILSLLLLVFQVRTRLRKFTLAGILLAGGTDLQDWNRMTDD